MSPRAEVQADSSYEISPNATIDGRRMLFYYAGAALIYFLLARLGLCIATLHQNVSPVWPATGFAIGAVLILGNPAAVAIFIAAFLANILTNLSVGSVTIVALGNTLEALVGASILRSSNAHWSFFREMSYGVKVLASSVAASAVSATIGSLAISLDPATAGKDLLLLWLTWMTGDCLGALMIVPLMVRGNRTAIHSGPRDLRFMLYLLLPLISSAVVFFSAFGSRYPFILYPMILLLGSLRPQLLPLSSLIVSVGAISATLVGTGPFVSETLNTNLNNLQLFLGTLSVTGLMVIGLGKNRSLKLASLVLLIGWFASATLFMVLQDQTEERDAQHFSNLISDVEAKIMERMRIYTDGLQAGVSLFGASSSVDYDEWKDFVVSLKITERYPGIRGMGVAWPVSSDELGPFMEGLSKMVGRKVEYASVPGGDIKGRNDHFIITYLEPHEVNATAHGLDIGSESKRRYAAERSRLTGLPIMTTRITLAQDVLKRPGFLLFFPLYRRGQSHTTPEENLENFEAWIFAPFVIENFFQGIRGSWDSEVNLTLYEPLGTDMLFSTASTAPSVHDYVSEMELLGQTWIFGWNKNSGFKSASQQAAIITGVSAALTTLILAIFVATLSNQQVQTEELVQQRTAELVRSRDELTQKSLELQSQSQELMSARDRAMAATVAKSQFLANMSHEIRTPLTAVIGFSQEMLRGELNESEKDEALSTIARNGFHLLRVIDDILDLSKIEAGKMEIESIDMNLMDLISDIVMMMREQAVEKGLDFRIEYAWPLPAELRSDPTRLKQILINLLGNAIKFTSAGYVSLRVSYDSTTQTVSFAVRDTGIGLTSDQVHLIFQAFSQADPSTTRQFGGTGLGLVISSSLCKKLGGEITLESEPGKGSTFTATVSCGKPSEKLLFSRNHSRPEIRAESAHARKFKPGKVLLAEDGKDNQTFIGYILRKAGLECCMVDNGSEAVERAAHERFDLILMDMQMPVMDGYTAATALRQQGSRVPIIAITANIMAEERDRCLAAGCDDYVGKPFKRDELLDKLAKHLSAESPSAIPFEDDEEMRAIYEGYVRRLPIRLAAMLDFHASARWEELSTAAHQMKGAAGNLTLLEIADCAHEIEAAVREGRHSEIERPLNELQSCVEKTVRTLSDAQTMSGAT